MRDELRASVTAIEADEFVQDMFMPFSLDEDTQLHPMPLWHRSATRWDDAPLPPRFHRCRVQTHGVIDGEIIDRCACGARRYDGTGHPWGDRNQRRKFAYRLMARIMRRQRR